jgi:surface antigen
MTRTDTKTRARLIAVAVVALLGAGGAAAHDAQDRSLVAQGRTDAAEAAKARFQAAWEHADVSLGELHASR